MDKFTFAKIRNVKSPVRGTELSAGIDFFIPEDWNDHKPHVIGPGGDVLIPSGIKAKVPKGYALIAFNKSGISTKQKLIVGACVVDEDYQGEIHIHLINTNKTMGTTIGPGMKVAQFILIPVSYAMPEEVDLDDLYTEATVRGEGGFGSTGNK